MKRLITLIAFAILLQTCASYDQPPVEQYIPDTPITYYNISGSTEDELKQQMSLLGPIGDDGKRHWSYTKWDMGEFGLFYNMNVIIPRWTPPKDVDPDLIAKWDNVVKTLAIHENGHVKIVRNNVYGSEASRSCLGLSDVEYQISCDEVRGQVDLGIENIKKGNDQYDARTNNGVVTFDVNPDKNESLNATHVPPPTPQKTVAERFAELNEIKKNVTK